MSLIRYSPLQLALSRWPDIWEDELVPGNSASSTPANTLNIYETEDQVVVQANVAGVPSDQIEMTFEKGVLWIQAEHQEQSDELDNKKHYRRASWSYSYKVAVPGDLDLHHEPSAEVNNGVLTVTFKKSEVSKPRKLRITAKKA